MKAEARARAGQEATRMGQEMCKQEDWESPSGQQEKQVPGKAAHTTGKCLEAKAQNHKVKSILGYKVKPHLNKVWGSREGGWT